MKGRTCMKSQISNDKIILRAAWRALSPWVNDESDAELSDDARRAVNVMVKILRDY